MAVGSIEMKFTQMKKIARALVLWCGRNVTHSLDDLPLPLVPYIIILDFLGGPVLYNS